MGFSLSELFVAVKTCFVFDRVTYPKLPEDPDEARVFAIRHVQDHISKSHGAVAGILERADHTGVVSQEDRRDLEMVAMKQLINAVKLVEVAGVPPERFDEYLKRNYMQ